MPDDDASCSGGGGGATGAGAAVWAVLVCADRAGRGGAGALAVEAPPAARRAPTPLSPPATGRSPLLLAGGRTDGRRAWGRAMLALLEGEDRAQAGRGCGGWLMEGGGWPSCLTSAEREGGREGGGQQGGGPHTEETPTVRASVTADGGGGGGGVQRVEGAKEEGCVFCAIASYLFCMC